MANRIEPKTPEPLDTADVDRLRFDPGYALPDLTDLPNPETFTVMINTVLQPWAIESEETISATVRAFVASEIDHISSMNTGQLAWAAAELVVARQAEILGSNDAAVQEGYFNVAEIARMFEHVFVAGGGAALDGQPT